MQSKLSVRLALLFLVASLVPLVATAGMALNLMRDSLHEEAQRRHAEVAQLCASVVEVWLDSTSDKLLALAEVMRVDLLERQVRPGEPVSEEELISLQNRIAPLIDTNADWSKQAMPALELEFFQNVKEPEPQTDGKSQKVKNGAPSTHSYEGKMAVSNTQWMAQNDQPAVKQQVADRKGGRAASQLVQQPIEMGTVFCEANIEVIDGTPTLAMSAPVGDLGRNFGALVADIDFTELRDMLGKLAGDGVTIRVADELDTALFEMGSPSGELLSQRKNISKSGWSVTVAEELSRIEAPLDDMRRQTGMWIGAASILALLISVVLSAGITRPVRALTRAAEAMEAGDLSARTGFTGTDEIGQLAASFDRMATALDHLDNAKTEFVGNVSHELRTPLTSMRLSIANLMDGVVGELDERQQRTLARVQRELDRMIRMVSELLEMARLEAGMVEPTRIAVDLTELAEACAAVRRPEAAQREISIKIDGRGSAQVDPAMIRRVLDNLVDNALKFSPPGSCVSIVVDGARLRILDEGPGFEPETRSAMFEKFKQGQVQGAKHDGVGLGLAIVSRLVALNDGRIVIEDRPAGVTGASVLVELPAVPKVHA